MARQGFFSRFSSGERSFIWAMIGTSVAGAILALVAVMRLSEAAPSTQLQLAFTFWACLAGCIGGVTGIWYASDKWFGFSGLAGWITASFGSLAATGIAAVIAGSLILPFYGTMFAPLQVIMMMIDSPFLAVIWFGMMICAQGLLQRWRNERESIFST